MSRPLFLMSPPDAFAIFAPHPDHGGPNKFSHENYAAFAADPDGFRAVAKQQWLNLQDALQKHGAEIITLPADVTLPDGPFTADASLSHITADGERVILLSRFSNIERAAEVTAHKALLAQQFPDIQFTAHEYACEGTGDNIYDPYRNCYWSGYTDNPSPANAAAGRSDIRAHQLLAQQTGCAVHSLAVKAPFYHLDTTFAPLPMGHILASREGLSESAWQSMLAAAFDGHNTKAESHLIEVSREDTYAFGCNVVTIGKVVIMPLVSDALRRQLEAAGYQVEMVNISQFTRAGGAVHCLTNRLNGVY